MKNSKLTRGKNNYPAQSSTNKSSLLALLDGDAKDFYKALFRLNLLLDIHIDEEDFHRPEDIEGSEIDRNLILDLVREESEGINGRYEPIINVLRKLLEKIPEILQDTMHSIDSGLQSVWMDYLATLEDISISSSEGKPSVNVRFLRLKGICLLVIIKYTQAMLQVDIFRKNLSKAQDAVTRFASASLSNVITMKSKSNKKQSEKIESDYLQILLHLGCASCASSDSSIGFLKLAEQLVPKKSKYKLYREFIEIFPYYDFLFAYNYAIAYSHSRQRDKALEYTKWAIRQIQQTIFRRRKTKGPYVSDLRRYLEIPLLQLQADILSKNQYCSNAINTLCTIDKSATEIDRLLSADSKKASLYKRIQACLLKALCWLDMGDIKQAQESIRIGIINEVTNETEIINPEIFKVINNISSEGNMTFLPFVAFKDVLLERPVLHIDVIKFVLQYNLEMCRIDFRRSNSLDNNLIIEAEKHIKQLSKFIKVHRYDRFQRQNLKEIAIDWLRILSDALKNANDGLVWIRSEKWRNAVSAVMECLNMGPKNNRKSPPYKIEGNIANEIWGEHFKRLDRNVAEYVKELLTTLTDNCEKVFNPEKYEHSRSGKCTFQGEKRFLRKLAKFEIDSYGLRRKKNGDVEFSDFLIREDEDIYPRKESYDYRRAIRRGRFIVKYMDNTLKVRNSCKNNCSKRLVDGFTWLRKETDIGNKFKTEAIHICLKRLHATWRGKNNIKESVINRDSVEHGLKLSDYGHIIADSDFFIRLSPGRSEQPIHIYHNKDENNNKKKKSTGVEFVALRRWNSYTPELSFSKGGGYFVFVPYYDPASYESRDHGGIFRSARLGVVVDPGFDFIHNFFNQGFTLEDIDVILITHADSDHINDYGGLVDLLRERDKRVKESNKKIYAFMPNNARVILDRYITGENYRRLYYDTILVDDELLGSKEVKLEHKYNESNSKDAFTLSVLIGKNTSIDKPIEKLSKENKLLLKIQPVTASHDDHTGNKPGSYGYVLEFKSKESDTGEYKKAVIGFTGDSQWFPDFAKAFEDCDLVCSHMGSIFGDNFDDYGKQTLGQWEALIRKKNHPYLPGEILFLEQLRKMGGSSERIVVISEFGEEMKGRLRKDLCERLNRCLQSEKDGCWQRFVQEKKDRLTGKRCKLCPTKRHKTIRTIPADVGLRISILHQHKPLVHCIICDHFADPDDMAWIAYGSEEALFYVCGPCSRSKPPDVLTGKYKNILEYGRPLRKPPADRGKEDAKHRDNAKLE